MATQPITTLPNVDPTQLPNFNPNAAPVVPPQQQAGNPAVPVANNLPSSIPLPPPLYTHGGGLPVVTPGAPPLNTTQLSNGLPQFFPQPSGEVAQLTAQVQGLQEQLSKQVKEQNEQILSILNKGQKDDLDFSSMSDDDFLEMFAGNEEAGKRPQALRIVKAIAAEARTKALEEIQGPLQEIAKKLDNVADQNKRLTQNITQAEFNGLMDRLKGQYESSDPDFKYHMEIVGQQLATPQGQVYFDTHQMDAIEVLYRATAERRYLTDQAYQQRLVQHRSQTKQADPRAMNNPMGMNQNTMPSVTPGVGSTGMTDSQYALHLAKLK